MLAFAQSAASASSTYVQEMKENHFLSAKTDTALDARTSTITLTNTIPEVELPRDTDNPLDGGLRAWLAVLGGFLALFATFGLMNSFGTFQTWYSTHQLGHLPPSTISWIGSLQLWMFFFSGGPIGRFYDTFGPKVLMIVGTIIYTLAIMMTSISTRFYQFVLCQGLLFGLGVGMLFYPCMASVSTHFKKLQATALGLVAAGSSLGGVIYPIMLRHLFDSIGFGWAVRVFGLISALCCITAVLTVTTRLPPKQRKGLCVQFSGFKDVRFVLLTIGSAFVALGLFIPFFYLADFAHDSHLSSHMSFYALAVLNGGGFFGRIAPSWLSDTFGRYNLLFPSAFLSGLLCLTIWLLSHQIVPIMFFAALYGFFSGAFVSLITPCVIQISDKMEIGTRLGTLYTVISFPSLLGGPIGGFLLKAYGSYVPMSAFAGSTIIAGSILIFVAKLRINESLCARV